MPRLIALLCRKLGVQCRPNAAHFGVVEIDRIDYPWDADLAFGDLSDQPLEESFTVSSRGIGYFHKLHAIVTAYSATVAKRPREDAPDGDVPEDKKIPSREIKKNP